MAVNCTQTSTQGSTVIDITADSTADLDVIALKIKHACSFVCLFNARVVVLAAKLNTVDSPRRSLPQSLTDATTISQTYKEQLAELWNAAESFQAKIQGQKMHIFNLLVPDLLYPRSLDSSNYELNAMRNQILEYGHELVSKSKFQQEVALNKEQMELALVRKKKQMVELIAYVGDSLEQAELPTHQRKAERKSQRILKTKIAQWLINCLLSSGEIDFEENPDLLDLKIKWRH